MVTKGFFDGAGISLKANEYQLFILGNPDYSRQNYYYSKFFENYEADNHENMLTGLIYFITNNGQNLFEYLIDEKETI